MNDLYVYAVLRAPSAGERDLVEEPLQLIDCRGMQAVAGPAVGGPVVDAAALRAHDAVVRRLHGVATSVLPMRFGAMVRDEAALRGWVETVRPILERGLDLVRDKEQMVIRIYGDSAPAVADDHDGGADQRGTRYLMKRRPQEIPEDLAEGIEALRRRLGDLVQGERVERHTTAPLILTLRHLVPRDASGPYRAAATGDIPGLERLTLRVSGPWPPYAFTPEELS